MPPQASRRAVVVVHVQRGLGSFGRLRAAVTGIGGPATRREGALGGRHRKFSKSEATILASWSALPSRLSVAWTSGNGEDFAGVGPGGAFRVVGVLPEPRRFQRQKSDECDQPDSGEFGVAV